MLKDFTKEKFDIIIQAGQSNAEGNGMGTVLEPYIPDTRVWMMNGPLDKNEFTIDIAAETVRQNEVVSNFIFSFVRKYVNAGLLPEDRKLLILHTAVGGTGFIDGQWKTTDIYYLRMMEIIRTALALNPENRLVGLLWHQGESDSLFKASFDVHYEHLMTLVRSVREEFKAPNLPFVAADFVHDWRDKNIQVCTPVIDAIRAVCKDCGHGTFVETDGLTSNVQQMCKLTPHLSRLAPHLISQIADDIHFSRNALYQLGERYFDAFQTLQ